MNGQGGRQINPIVWWLAAVGAVMVIAPELVWVPLLVAAVFLGTRESGPHRGEAV